MITFSWMPDGGTNNRYIVDSGFDGKKKSNRVGEVTEWTLPTAAWNNIPSGARVNWRVRGVDLDQTPLTIITSDEVWSFTKQ